MSKVLSAFLIIGCLIMGSSHAEGETAAGEDLRAKLKELGKEMRDIKKKLGPFKAKMDKNEELKSLRATMDKARKAYEARFLELVADDRDGADLVARMKEIRVEIKAAQASMKKLKKGKKPKKKNKAGTNDGGNIEAPGEL